MGNSLEYEEEDYDDLFGEDSAALGFVDTRKAITKERAPWAERPPASSPRPPSKWPTIDERLAELLSSRKRIPPPPSRGARSLHAYTLHTVRANSWRIWNIGGLEYHQIPELLDDIPREQLQEIEEASPDDTDWLWEIYILQEFPLFHERCRERRGERRISGWRRMYAKAQKDSEERKANAMARVAERYAQMDAQRASKKIVVMNELIAPQKGRKSHTMSTARRGQSSLGAYSAPSKVQSAIAKARVDAQRARVALTHSSGKYIPPPIRLPPRTGDSDSMYRNPFLGPSSASSSRLASPSSSSGRIPPPRLPPRAALAGGHAANSTHASHSHTPTMGSRAAVSAGVPDDVESHRTAASRVRTIHKPEASTFVPTKPKQTRMDFFGVSEREPKRLKTEVRVAKVRREDHLEQGKANSTGQANAAGPSSAAQSPSSSEPAAPSRSGARPQTPTPMTDIPSPRRPQRRMATDSSVLFIKKRRPPPRR